MTSRRSGAVRTVVRAALPTVGCAVVLAMGITTRAVAADGVVEGERPARKPFASLTAGTVRVGGRPVEVVVADSLAERVQGLRGRPDPAPYAAMLFAFPTDTTTAFTMSGVPAALDIAFFDRRGRRVDRLRMAPCAGTDASCPVYEADARYRYALETAAGEMPSGRLRVSR